jgi:hypothetical protein
MLEFVVTPTEDALCVRLGRIVTRWTTLEKLISYLLGTMLGAQLGGMTVITSSVSVATQMKWIRALMAAHQQEAANNLLVTELLGRADELRGERNELVHGQWDSTDCETGTSLVTTVNLERNEIIRSRLVTTHDLEELSSEIDDWIQDYVTLGTKLGFPRNAGESKSIFLD